MKIESCDELMELSSEPIEGGLQKIYEHYSKCTDSVMRFSLYLPPQAFDVQDPSQLRHLQPDNAKSKLPILYYLSGAGSSEQEFIEQSDFQRHAAQHGLVVCGPDTSPRDCGIDGEHGYEYLGAGASWYLNATEPKWRNYQMFEYITQELPALLEHHFPIIDGNRKGITGYSMGGHGAMLAALKRPYMFKSVSALAPCCDATRADPGSEYTFSEYLGSDKSTWKQWNVTDVLNDYNGRPQHFLIDQGTADNFYDQLKVFNLIRSAGHKNVDIDLRLRGNFGHDYEFVAAVIGDHLKFHAEALCAAKGQ